MIVSDLSCYLETDFNAFALPFTRFHQHLENEYYQGDFLKKNSMALNVALAAGLSEFDKKTKTYSPLRDVKPESLEAKIKKPLTWKKKHKLNLDSAYFAADSVANLSGFGVSPTLAGGLISLGLAVLSYGKGVNIPARSDKTIIWMPEQEVKHPREIGRKLRQLFKDAFLKALPEEYLALPLPNSKYEEFKLVGGDVCKPEEWDCKLSFPIWNYRPFKTKSSPQWLHIPGKTFFYRQWHPFSLFRYKKKNVPNEVPDIGEREDKMFFRMSQFLPKWIFFYRAPSKKRPYPVIYNQGEKLFFIAPGFGT